MADQLNMNNSTYPGFPVPSVNRYWDTTEAMNNKQLAGLVQVQAYIWVSIMLAIITIASTCAMCYMNDPKTRDSLLYAKFLTNMKDK